MARIKGAIPTKPLTVHLPVDTLSKLQLHLFSEIEGRVPHGAYAKLLVGLVDAYLQKLDEQKDATWKFENGSSITFAPSDVHDAILADGSAVDFRTTK